MSQLYCQYFQLRSHMLFDILGNGAKVGQRPLSHYSRHKLAIPHCLFRTCMSSWRQHLGEFCAKQFQRIGGENRELWNSKMHWCCVQLCSSNFGSPKYLLEILACNEFLQLAQKYGILYRTYMLCFCYIYIAIVVASDNGLQGTRHILRRNFWLFVLFTSYLRKWKK